MKKTFPKFYLLLFLISILSIHLKAQPFIDIANYNSQFLNATYKDSLHSKNRTSTFNLNVFIPKKFKNDNTFLFRLAGEEIFSTISNTTSTSSYSSFKSNTKTLCSFSMPVGFQFVSKNKKWKTLVMGIPKISSDLRDNMKKDYQYGGTLLFTYVQNDSLLKLKFGIFYNRECFGNFFVPLLGIDWKATKHLSVYGILPNNMRIEYSTGKKFYFGIGFKNYKRSYRLYNGEQDDFVLVRETQGKLFADYFLWKKVLLFVDASYVLKFDFAQYAESDMKMKTPVLTNEVYTPMNPGFLFTVGLAYRLRMD